MSHLLEVEGLTTVFTGDYGETTSVDHVSFHVDEGEVVCIVGESGCGKSVTNLSVMGLLSRGGKVTEGRVLFEDRDLLAMSETGADEIILVSARKGKNVKELITVLLKYMPDGEYVFNPDAVSDKSEKFMVGELMREKILLKYEKEIPHGVAVVVNEFSRRGNGIYDIDLDIICEKPNHKAIIIGKGGQALKEVSSFARESMEKFLGAKVYLKTYVKVKENWRDRADLLDQYGYGKKD